MDLLPLLSELARHAAESLGHDVRAEARTVYQEDAREVFVEIRTATASTSQTLIELEDELTFWLLETYPEVGREVTVYLKRA